MMLKNKKRLNKETLPSKYLKKQSKGLMPIILKDKAPFVLNKYLKSAISIWH
jgi:hypothetical protein